MFNLESNGRHEGPMKFDIKKDQCQHAFYLWSDYDNLFFRCGNEDIRIWKENEKSKSNCYQNSKSAFDFRGIQNALIPNPRRNWYDDNEFTPKRIIVIQMN